MMRFKKEKEKELGSNSGIRNIANIVFPWLENVLFGMLAAWISARVDLAFDIKLIYIMVMGLMYGVTHSVFAAVVCSIVFYLGFWVNGRTEINMNMVQMFVVHMFIAFVSGYVTTCKNIENKVLKDSYARLENMYEKIREKVSDTKKAAAMLAEQLRTSDYSISKVYSVIKKIESMDMIDLLNELPTLVSDFTGFRNVALFTAGYKGDKFNFHSATEDALLHMDNLKEFKLEDSNIKREVLVNRNVYISTKLESEIQGAIIPVQYNNFGIVIGVIVIKDIPFDKMNTNTEFVLDFLRTLVSDYFTKVVRYKEGEKLQAEG